MMSFLSYKVVRGTCLRFPEQLEVVVTGDVLQQRLPTRSVALAVILGVGAGHESSQILKYRLDSMPRRDEGRTFNSHPLTMYFSFCSLLRLEFLFLLSSVTFSL